MSIIKNNKNYGTKVKIEEVQPNPFAEYLTIDYVIPAPTSELKIMDRPANVSGWRYKGETEWRTPVSTISVTKEQMPSITLEYNLTDNTEIGWGTFNMCFNIVNIQLPSTVTTIDKQAFFNARGLTQLPDLRNITYLGNGNFYSTNIRLDKYVINDNIHRDWHFQSSNGFKASRYIYVNGILLAYMNGSFDNTVYPTVIDFSNGIDGLEIRKIRTTLDEYHTLDSIKLPATLESYESYIFNYSTINNDVYFYGTTPPRAENGDSKFFGKCTITGSIYVPAESVDAYKAVASELFSGNDYTNSIVAMP